MQSCSSGKSCLVRLCPRCKTPSQSTLDRNCFPKIERSIQRSSETGRVAARRLSILISNRWLCQVADLKFRRNIAHHFLEKLRLRFGEWKEAPKRVRGQ